MKLFPYLKLVLCISVLSTQSSISQKNITSQLSTTKLTVYNNGVYHIVKEGAITLNNKSQRLPIYNAPLFGSYWLFSNQPFELRLKSDTVKIDNEVSNYLELIQNNLNKGMQVSYTVVGTEKNITSINGKFTYFNKNSGLSKFISKEDLSFYLNLKEINITQIRFLETEKIITKKDSVFESIIMYSNSPKQNVELHYMANGINWIPSYFLKLSSNKSAKFEMKAIVENFGELVENTELELVLGPVNLNYGKKLDPFANNSLSNLSPLNNNYSYQKNLRSQPAALMMESDALSREDYATEGEKNENLYHYKLGKKTLEKNTKSYYQIFSTDVNYRKEYHIDFPVNFSFNQNTDKNLSKSDGIVNNYIIFKNTTNYPIANGVVFMEDGKDRFITQDELKYTPAEGEVWIHLGKVLDFETENTETEKSRNEGQKTYNKRSYYKVIVEGEIKVKNLSTVTAKTIISKDLNGLLIPSKGLVPTNKTVISKAYDPNPLTKHTYEVELKPNESKIITYEYELWLNY